MGTATTQSGAQVWVAVSVYVLLAIIKRELKLDYRSLAEIQQILSVTLFEKTPVLQVLTTFFQQNQIGGFPKQIQLFDL